MTLQNARTQIVAESESESGIREETSSDTKRRSRENMANRTP
jgi:hypothetical protein